jgi:replicative DNA helicase
MLGELKAGDRVALARNLPEPAETDPWSRDRVALLGQLVGDGSYLKGQPLRYTTASEANSRRVSTAAESLGSTFVRYAGRGRWHQLLISNNGTRWRPAGVGGWLKELGIFGQRSHEKRIPAEAFRLPNQQVALLLRHLWATDGCIWSGCEARRGTGRRRVYFATASEALARDVAALLLRLGIVSRIRTADRDSRLWTVDVSGGEAIRRFLDTVGAFGPRVAPALRLAATLPRAASNVDTLPAQVWDTVSAEMRTQGLTQREMAALRGTSYGGSAHMSFIHRNCRSGQAAICSGIA